MMDLSVPFEMVNFMRGWVAGLWSGMALVAIVVAWRTRRDR